MIVDRLSNAALYENINERITRGLNYLKNTDLVLLATGKYAIDGDNIFVIVQEYDTLDAANEQMEAHKKHIDVQYMIQGEELVGHALFKGQAASKQYSEDEDYMLFPDTPSFFTKMDEGTFMIFFPADLHMPCIKVNESKRVMKAVVKVKI
jgi:YhcH/YjgK/YiaL family protein